MGGICIGKLECEREGTDENERMACTVHLTRTTAKRLQCQWDGIALPPEIEKGLAERKLACIRTRKIQYA